MSELEEIESGYVSSAETGCYIGSTIGDVEVIRITKTNVIARGRRYGRQWLLKGLREELRGSSAMLRQLQKEFEIHSRLRCPSVVQVVGLENVEGLGLCIIQEWVEGVTLHEALRKDGLDSSERRRIIRELTKAVACLHANGIVHRDLKPSNVMIRDIGRELVLIDFGLADTADYVEVKGAAGTPGFISPEQMVTGGADPADDVYSLGVIMREVIPAYKRLADRCTGPLNRRPKDASALLKLIDARAKRPRIIACVAAAALLVALAVSGINRINILEYSYRTAAQRVGELSEENNRNAALVSSLEDSLTKITSNLQRASGELDRLSEYERMKQSAVKDGCLLIDKCLRRHDETSFADCVTPDQIEFNDRLMRVTHAVVKTMEDYCMSLDTIGLSKEDVEIIKATLTTYLANHYQYYQTQWLKKRNTASGS